MERGREANLLCYESWTEFGRGFAAWAIFWIPLKGFSARLKPCPKEKRGFRAGPMGRQFMEES
jgi:hypothetical protein